MADPTQTDEQSARSTRPTVIGTVMSAKMQDTIVVREDRHVLHPLYKKHMKRKTKYVAHDAGNTCGLGDVVEIAQTRPMSKTKRWRLVRVLRKGPAEIILGAAATTEAEGEA